MNLLRLPSCLMCLALLLLLPALAANGVKLEAPNLSLNVYQRIFPTAKAASIALSTYNLHEVTFAVYPVNIETLIPDTTVLDAGDSPKNSRSVVARLKALSLTHPLASWAVRVKHPYPNDWCNQQVKLPLLPHGVYVVEARGGGVTQRTWLAISSLALITKRSPDLLQAWLVQADHAAPVARTTLVLFGPHGRLQQQKTGMDGLAPFTVPLQAGTLWVAARDAEPAFARALPPEAEKPYRVYLYTDRPILPPRAAGVLPRHRARHAARRL